jgi:hypothetical protein
VVAAANQSVYRITTQNAELPGTPLQEFWFDVSNGTWSGPHTLYSRIIAAYNNTFIVAPVGIDASLWQSDVINTTTSSFTENGVQLSCRMTTSLLPDTQSMSESYMIETTVELTLPTAPYTMSFTPLDEDGANILPAVTLSAVGGASYWGSAVWGTSYWLGTTVSLRSVQIPWTDVLVFKRMALDIQVTASPNLRIGAMSLRYHDTGYIQQ